MHFSHILLLSLGLGASPAFAFDQATAQQSSQNTQNQGSDQSLQGSYGNALHALDNVYQLNIPGALQYGLKAYGQYQNSQTMTALQTQAQANSAGMASVGGTAPSSTGVSQSSAGQYLHLGTSFLYQGDTAQIAEKVESFTGISREKMFQLAATFQSTAKSPTDPDFLPWALDSFHQITAKAQPGPLKDSLTKLGEKADAMVASGEAKSLLAKFNAGQIPGATTTANATQVASADSSSATATGTTTAALDSVAEHSAEDPSVANQFSGVKGSEDPQLERLKFQPVDGFLTDLMQRSGTDKRSLFEVISQKLRELNGRLSLEKHRK